jgi:hypothetical protein
MAYNDVCGQPQNYDRTYVRNDRDLTPTKQPRAFYLGRERLATQSPNFYLSANITALEHIRFAFRLGL